MGADAGDMVFVIADQRRTVNHILGLLRLELARPPVGEGGLNFLWITEFPLFESVTDSGEPIPAHHPFTMPHPDDLAMLDTASGAEYLSIRSQAYDLVLNGWELGSGSVRIHKKDIQAKIFNMLGIQDEEAEQNLDSCSTLLNMGPLLMPDSHLVLTVLSLCLQEKRIFVRLLHFQKRSREAIL